MANSKNNAIKARTRILTKVQNLMFIIMEQNDIQIKINITLEQISTNQNNRNTFFANTIKETGYGQRESLKILVNSLDFVLEKPILPKK